MKIIERVEQGEKMADIAHSYNMNYLTRHDSKKQKQDHGTCEVCCVMMSTIISKKHARVMEEMENFLSVCMQDQHQCGGPRSLMLIQEKVKSLYEGLKKKYCEN